MSRRSIGLSEPLYQYLLSVSAPEPEVLRRLREETANLPEAHMQIAPEQGALMALLAELIGARQTLEIGVFTGYSALAVALALPADGQLIACDIDRRWTTIARRFWRAAGVEQKIDLRLAPALETLDALLQAGEAGRFDMAFIDADKPNYINYYNKTLALLRPGGLLIVDNVLWKGAVIDQDSRDEDTLAIRDFNRQLAGDERVTRAMLPVADGLTLARKRI